MDSLGRHIIIELFDCEPENVDDVVMVQKGMEQAAVEAGATLINSTFHHFAPMGVSGVVVIQESHLSIHTWPEYGFASVDIFTCGDSVDPWKALSVIQKCLGAKHHSAVEMLRGQKSQLGKRDFFSQQEQHKKTSRDVNRQIWFTERTDNYALSIKHQGDLLFRNYSDFQRIEVYHTEAFGKMLVLDGVIVLTEKDGFVYHEMIAHIPMLYHHLPKNVLVLGGGDGAVAAEILKHASVKQVDVVEIDKGLQTVIERFFPSLYTALCSKKVVLRNEDITAQATKQNLYHYDVIIDDLHNALSTECNSYHHLSSIKNHLNDTGFLVTSVGSPHLNKAQFKSNVETLRAIFGNDKVVCYQANIPTFPTGLWCFALCSKGELQKLQLQEQKIRAFTAHEDFQYYSAEVHKAAFTLPPYIKKLIE